MILSMISSAELAASLGPATLAAERPTTKRGPSRATRDPQTNPLYADLGNSVSHGFRRDNDPGAPIVRSVPNTEDHISALRRLVATAASDHGYGYRFRVEVEEGGHQASATYWAVELPADYGTFTCPECNQGVRATSDGRFRTHGPRDSRCIHSGQDITE